MESECVAIATVAKGARSNWGSPWVEFALWSAPHNMAGEGAGYGSGHVGTVSGLCSCVFRCRWLPSNAI